MKRRAFWVAAAAIAMLPAVRIVALRWSSLRAAVFRVRGKAGACSLGEAMEAPIVTARQIAGGEEIRPRMKLVERDPGGQPYVRYETPQGSYWLASGSEHALNSFIYELSEQARGIYAAPGSAIRPGDVVLDCGASVGVFTREALRTGASHVVAIEPDPGNLECLRRNLREEIARGQVTVYPKGVWDKSDTLKFGQVKQDGTKGSLAGAGETGTTVIEIPVTTVDRIVDELKLSAVNFIKMDIEGAERQALAGARGTLARFRPRMAICVYHLADDPTVIPRVVQAAWSGYRHTFQCLNYEKYIEAEVAHFVP